MNGMASKRKPPAGQAESTGDRHKPSKMYRVPMHLALAIERLAEKEWTTGTTQVMLAVKFYLQHKGELAKPAD